jgi:DNA (cytosine-5)-methyltransferase 1
LTPVELERLNGFPDDWTRFDNEGNELPDTKRAFFMGNALVIGLIEKVGKVIASELIK